jgi:hypothetical protein
MPRVSFSKNKDLIVPICRSAVTGRKWKESKGLGMEVLKRRGFREKHEFQKYHRNSVIDKPIDIRDQTAHFY